jgi:hypothetical protein
LREREREEEEKKEKKNSIYGFNQASRYWYLKFDDVVTSFGFVGNKVDQCIRLELLFLFVGIWL